MSSFPSVVIIIWLVVMILAFPVFTPRRSLLVILFSGILFLPQVVTGAMELGPIKFAKANTICYALLLSALIYNSSVLFSLKFGWVDLPAFVWCSCPVITCLLNDPPPDGSSAIRDAISQAISQCTQYLIPYLIGRAYFSDPAALRELAVGTVVAGLVYVPFCLYEIRMSPHLHSTVYGYSQHSFLQTIRYGGFRPMVFMQHGLAVGMLMATAFILAAWVRRTDPTSGRWRDSAVWVLGPTVVLCKSTGAILIAAVGFGMIWLVKKRASRWLLMLLVMIPPIYCITRTTGLWSGAQLVDVTNDSIDADRAQSLSVRFEQENLLIDRALQRPGFGWGGWGRNRVVDREGRDVSVTDGMWIIFLGTYGIIGLTAFGGMMLIPVFRYARRVSPHLWATPKYAAVTGCAVVIGLWCVDSLFNAMANPLYLIMAAGLTELKLDNSDDLLFERSERNQPPQVAS